MKICLTREKCTCNSAITVYKYIITFLCEIYVKLINNISFGKIKNRHLELIFILDEVLNKLYILKPTLQRYECAIKN